MGKKRILYLEIIRIVAVILVIYNHTGYDGYHYASSATSPVEYGISLVLSVLCKIAVPLFFMVSGALLLGREEPLSKVIQKRVVRILLVLLIISLFYYLVYVFFDGRNFSLVEFFTQVYSGYVVNSLWFLYAYLGFLLMLPLLRKIALGMGTRDFAYLLILKLLLQGVFGTIQGLSGLEVNEYFRVLPVIVDSVFYPLAGYCVADKLEKGLFTARRAGYAAVIGIAGLAAGCLVVLAAAVREGEFSDRYHNALIAVPAIAFFFVIKAVLQNRSFRDRTVKLLAFAGSCVFGTYLFEPLFRKLFYPVYTALAGSVTAIPAAVVWVFAVFAGGIVLTALLKWIPGIKKLL